MGAVSIQLTPRSTAARTAPSERASSCGPQVSTQPAPPKIAEAAGVWYDEFSNLSEPIPVTAPARSLLTFDDGTAGTRWADGLNATEATVPATYDHPHFGRWAAATTKPRRQGASHMWGPCPIGSLRER